MVYLFSMEDPVSKLTRMRLDLEEYSFDIVHVSGKGNALSRVEINSDQLKTLPILAVQTRSMTRGKTPKPDTNQNDKAKETDHLHAYNSVNNLDALSLPKIIFEFENNSINI